MSVFQYIIFYKPYMVMSQFSPEGDKQTLADYLDIDKDIYPVGRLDYDSEGLLLLSNDPAINKRLLHPNSRHKKTYFVQVEGIPDEYALQSLRNGVTISAKGKRHRTQPAKVKCIPPPEWLPERHPPIRFRKNIPTSWLAIEIKEGKNRQVRKMTAAVGFPTLRLIRVAIGNIELSKLTPGSYRHLSANELPLLFAH